MKSIFQQFLQTLGDLVTDPKIRSMETITHHTDCITCFDHSMYVSYVGFVLSRWLGGNRRSIVKGGLLHDLYLCDWKKERTLFRHLQVHPEMAVKNAQSFGPTDLERGIIRNHMWPVTITKLPRHREEFIVSLADKICAISEVSGLYWHLKCCRRLQRV